MIDTFQDSKFDEENKNVGLSDIQIKLEFVKCFGGDFESLIYDDIAK